jgi:hypothetical protein
MDKKLLSHGHRSPGLEQTRMAIPNGVPTAEESRKMINIIARNLAVWPKEWDGRLARRSVEKGGEKNQLTS